MTVLCPNAFQLYSISSFAKCIKEDYLVGTYLEVSIDTCVLECMLRTQCNAVNYEVRYLKCGLFSEDAVFRKRSKSENCVLVLKANMTIPLELPVPPCTDGQRRNPQTHVCEYRECPRLHLDNGIINGGMVDIGSESTFVCNPLYQEVNMETHTECLTNGSWRYIPACECIHSYENLGCYADRRNRALKGKNFFDPAMTHELCFSFCCGYTFIMIESNDECYCGNELTYNVSRSDSECQAECLGDPTQICGGYWRGTLFRII
ncbi:WSC domain-containing protein 2 [Mactra antiquata]